MIGYVAFLDPLLYDISQIAIPFDNVDEELVKAPQRWNPGELGCFMLFFGPVISVFDIVTLSRLVKLSA